MFMCVMVGLYSFPQCFLLIPDAISRRAYSGGCSAGWTTCECTRALVDVQDCEVI